MLNKMMITGLLASIGFSSNTLATEGEFYWLPRIGAVMFENQQYFSDKPSLQLGLVYGYGLIANFAIEVEGSFSIGGGGYSTTNGAGQYKSWLLGAFGVMRLPISDRDLYLKAKLGGVYENITHITPGAQIEDEVITGRVMQAGLGFGYQFDSGLSMEVEYVRGETNFDQFLYGMNYMF